MGILLPVIVGALAFFLMKCIISIKQNSIKKSMAFGAPVVVLTVATVILLSPYPLALPDYDSVSSSAVHDGTSVSFDDAETAHTVELLENVQLGRNIFGVTNFVVSDDEYYHLSVNFKNATNHMQSLFFHFGVTPAGEILFAYDEHYNTIINPQEIINYVVNVLSIARPHS